MEAQRNEVKEHCHSQVYLSESDMYALCYAASKIRVLEMIKGTTMNIIINEFLLCAVIVLNPLYALDNLILPATLYTGDYCSSL